MKQMARREKIKSMLCLKKALVLAELSKKKKEVEFRERMAQKPPSEITMEKIEALDHQLKGLMNQIQRLDMRPGDLSAVVNEMIQERVGKLRKNGQILTSVQNKIEYKLKTGQKTQLAQKIKRRDNILKEQESLADELATLTQSEEQENGN